MLTTAPDPSRAAATLGQTVMDVTETSTLHQHLQTLRVLCARCEAIDRELSSHLYILLGSPTSGNVSAREQADYDLYNISQAINCLSEKIQTIEATLQRFYQ